MRSFRLFSDQDDHELGSDERLDRGAIALGDPVREYGPSFGIFLVHDIKEPSASEGLGLVARPPDELDRYFRVEQEPWRKVIQDAGLRAE